MLTHSVVGPSGCREYESPAVVLVVLLGGLANIGQVAISLCRYVRCRRARTPARCRSAPAEDPSEPRHWHERRVPATPDEEAPQAVRSGMVAVLPQDWDTYLM